MQIVDSEALLRQAQETHQSGDLEKAELMYHDILNHNVGSPYPQYLLAALYLDKGYHAAAIALLENIVSVHVEFGEAWNNLGVGWQKARDRERADVCFAKCIEATAKYPEADIYADSLCNRAGCHINNGDPEKCLEYSNRALAANSKHQKAKWHKAIALLEMQKWGEAWEWHESRLVHGSADHNIEERNYAEDGMTPWWNGEEGLIAIHGEQGLGDEIMFASCIPDMRGEGRKFVFEPSPRSHNLFTETFKEYDDIHVQGTHATDGRDWIGEFGRPDYKVALGSLPKFCREKEDDFPGTPFIKAPPVAAAAYGKKLRALGPKPKIGIAWQGGVESTAVWIRSVFPKQLGPILELDADFISLQYTPRAEEDIKESGYTIHHWPEAVDARTPTGKNIGNLAALMSGLDMVVTVCQTAVHMAGALGIPCLCLTPSRPSWRYGVTGNYPWFSSVDLIRQVDEDWEPAIQEAADRVKAYLEQREAA